MSKDAVSTESAWLAIRPTFTKLAFVAGITSSVLETAGYLTRTRLQSWWMVCHQFMTIWWRGKLIHFVVYLDRMGKSWAGRSSFKLWHSICERWLGGRVCFCNLPEKEWSDWRSKCLVQYHARLVWHVSHLDSTSFLRLHNLNVRSCPGAQTDRTHS